MENEWEKYNLEYKKFLEQKFGADNYSDIATICEYNFLSQYLEVESKRIIAVGKIKDKLRIEQMRYEIPYMRKYLLKNLNLIKDE